MKILKVTVSEFKKCVDNLSVSFVPVANKTQEEYYGGKRLKIFIDNLKQYKKIKKHNKEELYLIDLLK